MALSPDKKRFAVRSLIAAAICFGLAQALVYWNDGRYRIGIDFQKNVHCLPWTVFFMERKPAAWLPERGDLVQYRNPRLDRGFAAFTMSKLVMGVAGDRVQIKGGRVYLNGRYVGGLNLSQALGKKPQDYARAFTLREGEYFLMGSQPYSYDSRYWGPIRHEEIIGRVLPIF
ncbi:signal peptidase I [Chromobacterium sp. IIBBL 290-4]|uniref:signal peptidase I n=1 Tax=Chromobacterium sp. IIBBL 290-4 TaxID=2953890 RepID=UPI0020B8B9BE|nr:signal peptidase I [Chromobacterium sp. IIBBL 290-4]UTH74235.1 signal peptidase I [Chromobacterium sp. IIBBL 290-4]